MITASMKACFVACILASCALTPAEVRAQAATELLPTERPIPDGYDSWSLFLVCNPAWIIENGDRGIADLFNQYRAFGRSIGPKNLAIWFWKKRSFIPTVDNTDIERSSEYCGRYKLLPSESPQVLVTTRNPDDPNPGDYVVVSLNGLAAKDGALVLLKLADQLVVTGLNQSGIDASDGWRRMVAAVRSAISAAGCFFDKVSFSFTTGIIITKIEHNAHC